MSGHERGCKLSACGSFRTCPECGGKLTPAKPYPRKHTDKETEHALRQRPHSGTDADGKRLDGLEDE